MTYDGLGRRIKKAVSNSGDWDATYHYYYDGQRMVEMRDGSDDVLKQYVWGQMYVDEIVQIGINDDPTDAGEDDCETYLFALQDANFNVLGLIESDGDLKERYEYTPYGQRTVYKSAGSDDPLCMAPLMSSQPHAACPDLIGSLCDVGHQVGACVESPWRCLLHDKEFGLIHNRARTLHPHLGRFLQRDPMGYVDGMSLYEYGRSGPHSMCDPLGLYIEMRADQRHLQYKRLKGRFDALLIGALSRLCPCVKIDVLKDDKGKPRLYRRTETTTTISPRGPTRKFRRYLFIRLIASMKPGDTKAGFCKCVESNQDGCRLVHDLMEDETITAVFRAGENWKNATQGTDEETIAGARGVVSVTKWSHDLQKTTWNATYGGKWSPNPKQRIASGHYAGTDTKIKAHVGQANRDAVLAHEFEHAWDNRNAKNIRGRKAREPRAVRTQNRVYETVLQRLLGREQLPADLEGSRTFYSPDLRVTDHRKAELPKCQCADWWIDLGLGRDGKKPRPWGK